MLPSDATEVSSFVTIRQCYLVVRKADAKPHHSLHVWARLGRQLCIPLQGQGLRCSAASGKCCFSAPPAVPSRGIVPNGSASDPGRHGDRI